MPEADANRWNERYRQEQFSRRQAPRPLLVKNGNLLPQAGLCLDVAMGTGNNAAFLLKFGLSVVGVDIAAAGLRVARQNFPGLNCILADLTQICFPKQAFDVILNFYYLQRDLFSSFKSWLKPGGVLFFETLTTSMLEIKPDIQEEYLLQPGELRNAFSDWEIIQYSEGWSSSIHGHQRAIASMIARNIG